MLRGMGALGQNTAHLILHSGGAFPFPRSGGLALAEALVMQGLHVEDPEQPDPRGRSWSQGTGVISFVVNRQLFHVADHDPGRGLVTCVLGPYPASAPVFERLARFRVDEDARDLRDDSNGVWVEVSKAFSPESAGAVFDWVNRTNLAYDEQLTEAIHHAPAHPAFDDMVTSLIKAGLAVPALPEALQAQLRQRSPWWWSTTESGPEPIEDYLMHMDPAAGYLRGPVTDHSSISHAGHGINSYALTWRLAFGPLAVLVQTPFGGAMSDAAEDAGAQAALLHRVSRLVRAVDEHRFPLSRTPRMRAILVTYSSMRGIAEVHRWDSTAGEWTLAIALQTFEKPEATWWEVIADLVAAADEPR